MKAFPRRIAFLIAVSTVTCSLMFGIGTANAGDYVVAQCHSANPFHEASSESADRGDYAMRSECTEAPDYALKVIPNTGASPGHRGYWYWQAPVGTRIVAVDVQAKLRRDGGHKARLFVADDAGQQIALVASGTDGPVNFTTEHWSAPAGSAGASRFYAALICDNNGSPCAAPSEAKTFVRNVELTLRDVSPPTERFLGDTLASGWRRGDLLLHSNPSDMGGGLAGRVALVNGTVIGPGRNFPCASAGVTLALALVPCPAVRDSDEDLALPTASPPFRDGNNDVLVCVSDFARSSQPNTGCNLTTVRVDNTPPNIVFDNAQDADDPELIKAAVTDATSGLAEGSGQIEYRPVNAGGWKPLPTTTLNGEMKARVDSEADPPGLYEFRATAADHAGNVSTSAVRGDQTPMVLNFPLKQAVTVDAFFPGGQQKNLAGYREAGTVRGFVYEPDGTGISGQRVTIREDFDGGALVQRRTVHVRTDAQGAFHSEIPGGPSRVISVRYPGSNRYLADRASELDFNVKSRVDLSVRRRVSAGHSAHFTGAVGRYFARVPAGGKLVELQYKKRAKTWNTADEAIGTTGHGKVSISYRFRRFYKEPVTFVFRLKVTREARWPYRVPASSKAVHVTVVPRDR